MAPSAASAAVWGPVGTTQSLDTVQGKYALSPGYSNGWTCKEHYTVGVRNPASSTLDITSVTYSNCVGFGPGWEGCKFTAKAEKLPWTISGNLISSNSLLNVGQMSVAGPCVGGEPAIYASGSIFSGFWDAAGHKLVYYEDPGLYITNGGNKYPVRYSATLVDPLQLLTLS